MGVEPAPGAPITLYAYGLGRTEPPGIAGQIVEGPVRLAFSTLLALEWLAPNGGVIERRDIAPSYAGLAPGSIGLYQLNIVIPSPPVGVLSCGPSAANGNLRMILPLSFGSSPEAVEICAKIE